MITTHLIFFDFFHGAGASTTPAPAPAPQTGAGKSRAKKKKTFVVEIDGETFFVRDKKEAVELIEAAAEQAQKLANAQAQTIVRKRAATARHNKTQINTEPVRLDQPEIVFEPETKEEKRFIQELKDKIDEVYKSAVEAANQELISRAGHQNLLDDVEALTVLLLN